MLSAVAQVAHTFQLGERYAAALGALAVPRAAPPRPLLMSCYGIGVTRYRAQLPPHQPDLIIPLNIRSLSSSYVTLSALSLEGPDSTNSGDV